MSDFNKKAIHFKKTNFENQISQFDARKEFFQNVVDLYNKSEIEQPLNESDLTLLLNSPKKLIIQKMNKVSDFEDEVYFDMLKKPAGVPELISFIENSKTHNSSTQYYYRWAYMFVIKNNIVELDEKQIESLKEQFIIYVKSESEEKIFNLLNEIADKVNELQKLKPINHINDEFFRDLLIVNSTTKEVSINYNCFQ